MSYSLASPFLSPFWKTLYPTLVSKLQHKLVMMVLGFANIALFYIFLLTNIKFYSMSFDWYFDIFKAILLNNALEERRSFTEEMYVAMGSKRFGCFMLATKFM